MNQLATLAILSALPLVAGHVAAEVILYDDDPNPNLIIDNATEVTGPVFSGTESFGGALTSGFESLGLVQVAGGPIITDGNTTLQMYVYIADGDELAWISVQLTGGFESVNFVNASDAITINGVNRGPRVDEGALPTEEWLLVELDLSTQFLADHGLTDLTGVGINRIDLTARFNPVEVYVDDVRLIPEPGSLGLAALGLVLLLRRHRHAQA